MKMLAKYVNENKDYEHMVKTIVDDIKLNYDMNLAAYRKGGEYFDKPMITVKVDGEMISPKDLLGYLRYKHKDLNVAFLKQIVQDWWNGKFINGNYDLSKNVALS